MQMILDASDVKWFAANPGRQFRLRSQTPEEIKRHETGGVFIHGAVGHAAIRKSDGATVWFVGPADHQWPDTDEELSKTFAHPFARA